MSEHDDKHFDQFEGTGGSAGENVTDSSIFETSSLSEPSPAEAILSELEIEPDEDYERNREKRAKRHAVMNKICGVSCTLFGTIGTVAVGACTAIACMLYGPGTGPGQTIQPDRFVPVSPVSSSSGPSDHSNPSSKPSVSSNSTQSQHTPQSSHSSQMPQSSVTPSSGDVSQGSQHGGSGPVSSQGAHGQTSVRPGISSNPSTPVVFPDTGEDMANRVPTATETELLKSQARRIARGESPYSNSDIKISTAGGLGIFDVSKVYGFSSDFIRKYNDHGGMDGIIRVPRI